MENYYNIQYLIPVLYIIYGINSKAIRNKMHNRTKNRTRYFILIEGIG